LIYKNISNDCNNPEYI
jgi:hypothetical protein